MSVVDTNVAFQRAKRDFFNLENNYYNEGVSMNHSDLGLLEKEEICVSFDLKYKWKFKKFNETVKEKEFYEFGNVIWLYHIELESTLCGYKRNRSGSFFLSENTGTNE